MLLGSGEEEPAMGQCWPVGRGSVGWVLPWVDGGCRELGTRMLAERPGHGGWVVLQRRMRLQPRGRSDVGRW